MKKVFAIALTGAAMTAAPALAWNDSQPASDSIAIWAYPSQENYCPAGLQPITINGVICCGTPTHTGYREHSVQRRHKPRQSVVQYSKGYSETVVYEKGQ